MKALPTQGAMNTRPVLWDSKGVSARLALCQRLQQCLRLLEVVGVKPLGEPAIDCRQQVVGLGPLALLLPQVSEAGGGAQFPGFGLLTVGDRDGLLEARLRLEGVRDGLPQQQLPR